MLNFFKKKPQDDTEGQKRQIRKALIKGEKITAIKALEKFGCFNLKARIHELRTKEHLPITTKMIEVSSGEKTKRVGEYSLDPDYKSKKAKK